MSDVPLRPAAPRKTRKAVARAKYDQRSAIESALAVLDAASPARALYASAPVQRRLEAYEQRDAAAARYQSLYKRLGLAALILTSSAIILGAASLMAPLGAGYDALRSSTSAVAVAFNIAVLALVAVVKRKALAAAWMTSRAKAERLRGMIFERLVGSAGAAPRAVVDALKITNAAHVDYQLGYFKSAKSRHLRPAALKTFAKLLAVMTFLASVAIAAFRSKPLAASVSGLSPLSDDLLTLLSQSEAVHVQLGLSVIYASTMAALAAWTLMNQDERNAKLYELSERRLAALKDSNGADAVAAAAAGVRTPVEAYLRDVRAILEADQQSWQLSPPPADPTLAGLRKLRKTTTN